MRADAGSNPDRRHTMNDVLKGFTVFYMFVSLAIVGIAAAAAATLLVDAALTKGLISSYGKWGASFAVVALYFWYQILLCDEAL